MQKTFSQSTKTFKFLLKNNFNQEFIEERCFFLNMFYKQMVRCPYLLNSEELKLFVRPHQEIDRSLALLPKLNSAKLFEKVSPYYTLMGDIELPKLQQINLNINNFCVQCRQNLVFLEKFKN